MGDYYDFEIRIIDGVEVSGISYQSDVTGWENIFVEMSDNQKILATDMENEITKKHEEKIKLIKSFLGK